MKTITNNMKTQTKKEFENIILNNYKCTYKHYLKMSNKKEFAKLVSELQTKQVFEKDELKTIVLLNSETLSELKKYIYVVNEKTTNNEFKKIVNSAYLTAFANGLQVIDKTKEEKRLVFDNSIKTFQFFRALQLGYYFNKKVVVYNNITKQYSTKEN